MEENALNYSGNADDEALLDGEPGRIEVQVPSELAGLRLDQALAKMLPEYSRSRLQDWVRHSLVRVDGACASQKDRVWGGENIEVDVQPDPASLAALPQAIALNIVHEDDDLVVIDKPAGLVVHPGSGNPDGTLLNALLHHAPALGDLPRAGIVHRLDKDTSGLLLVAKTFPAQIELLRQLQARTVRREYLAVALGTPPAAGQVDAPIGRHPTKRTRMAVVASGKTALTHYRVLRGGSSWSLIECRLDTGRTHQIRVHMHSIGHPLLGDPVYRDNNLARRLPESARAFPRQALHAARLQLAHPTQGGTIAFQSPLPPDLTALLAELDRHAAAS